MATPNKTKPKTMDVAHPETVVPDHSARPVIVTNRAMLEDPMMRSEKQQEQTEPTTSPLLTTHQKDVEPAETAAPKELSSKKAEGLAPAMVKKIELLPEHSEEDPKKESAGSPPELAVEEPAGSIEKPDEKLIIPVPDKETDETSDDATDQEKKPEVTPASTADSKSEEKPVEEQANTDDLDEQMPDSEADADAKRAEEEAKQEAAELEREEHLKSLVTEKTYYVPIRRQGKNGTAIAAILIVGAIVVIAGLVYINVVGMK